jgi:hypothetical protein
MLMLKMEEEIKQEFDKIWSKICELEKGTKKPEGTLAVSTGSLETGSPENLVDIEGDSLTLLKTLGEKTEEKTKNTALLTLFEYKEKLGKEKILASEIRRNVALNKIPLENFGTYLNNLIPQCILRVGKTRSKTALYKLTAFGYAKAKDIKKEILKNE